MDLVYNLIYMLKWHLQMQSQLILIHCLLKTPTALLEISFSFNIDN